ncbi:WD40 repeat domain-containing protein [Sporobolomyces salmoneus]|uniref:WD40 repeat domain-containing protein n=1 Tax=Sporobolomyces salmoneus TaxID=183962 RepID=UPI00316F18DD
MAKRKGTSQPKPSTSAAAPAAKKARFSNPPPPASKPASKPAAKTATSRPVVPAGPPKKFIVSAGSYERLLYGLECEFVPSTSSSSPSAPSTLSVKPIFSFPAHLSSLRTVAASTTLLSPDIAKESLHRKVGGKYLVSGGQDEVIKVWDLQRRKEVGSLEGDTTGTITCLRFCPQRNMLLSASSDSTISLYRVRDWVLLRSLKGHKGRVNSIDPHPEGRVCLSVGKDKNLRMWDLVAGKSVATLKLGTEGDLVRWNAKGTKFGVITANTLTVYGIDMSIHHTLTAPSRFHDLQFCTPPSSLDSEFLLVACEDGKVRVFDVSNPTPVKVGQEEDEEAFENRAKMEVCAELVGHTNRVKMMDLLEVALPESSTPHSTVILTTASSDGCINLYDLSSLPVSSSTASTTTKGKGKGKGKGKAEVETAKEKVEIKPIANFDTDKSRLTSICAIGLVEKRAKANGGNGEDAEEEDSSSSEEEEEENNDEEEEEEMLDKFAGEESGDENEEFTGVMINLSDNEIEEDSQDEDAEVGDGLDGLEELEDDEEAEFEGIEDLE